MRAGGTCRRANEDIGRLSVMVDVGTESRLAPPSPTLFELLRPLSS